MPACPALGLIANRLPQARPIYALFMTLHKCHRLANVHWLTLSTALTPPPPRSWQAIRDSQELRRMGRTHIHFATDPGLARRNAWATVTLRLLLAEALADGYAVISCRAVSSVHDLQD